MGVDHYDCYVCGDNGIYSEHVVSCDTCLKHICSRCFGCQEGNTDFVDYSNKKLYQEDEDGCENTIKEGFCKSCEDIENSKYVYVLMYKLGIEDTEVELYRNKDDAEKECLRIAYEYYKEEYGEEYGDNDILFFLGMEHECNFSVERMLIKY